MTEIHRLLSVVKINNICKATVQTLANDNYNQHYFDCVCKHFHIKIHDDVSHVFRSNMHFEYKIRETKSFVGQ